MESALSAQPAEQRRMPAQVRHSHLVETARRRGFFMVADIAAELGVSEMTIRRDLIELERDGTLMRTRGGAVAADGTSEPIIDREEPAFDARLRRNQDAKRRIALAASELVVGRPTVALDVGTTTYLLARLLAERIGPKFFTSSLRIAALLGERERDVHVPGGQIRGDEMSICGPSALEQFERYWFDIAFIGISGVTAEGMFDYSLDDSELKRVYLRRSSRKVVLCDSSKFHRMSLVRIADFADVDLLISEQQPPAEIAEALAAANVDIQVVPDIAASAL
jgi:DeoR family glycerol-3-phosphate regulon repressor